MNLHAVSVVYHKELAEWVRDRRTLISTVVVPLLLFPLIILGFSYLAVTLVGKAEKEIPKIMIIGGEDSPQIVAALQKIDTLKIVPFAEDWKRRFAPPSTFPRGFRRLSKRAKRKRSPSIFTRERSNPHSARNTLKSP